jgi:hypothetical protein
VLQRFSMLGLGILALLVLAGIFGFALVPGNEKPFYSPGNIPSREECFYDKLAQFRNVTKQIIYQVAQDCELEVQSLEGHEQMRQEWIERQAEKARQRAAEKAETPPPPVEEPKELDRVRRVWR